MDWKQHIFKPKWQHKNADIRLESVSTEQDPELIKNLLVIARDDADNRVRCAAIKRLHQLENILKLHAGETDKQVLTLLEERIHQLASSTAETRPPIKFRMQVIENSSDRDLIEHLASHAPEAELRRAALAKVERQGVLGDCCIQDPDAENRRLAASRITQHTSLKRVIDALRKRDKTLYAELQARLLRELLESNDPEAVATEALRICTTLERQALGTEPKETAVASELHAAWQRIAGHVDTDLTARYQRICERLATPQVVAPEPEAPAAVVEETATGPQEQDAPPPEATEAPLANESLVQATKAICLYEAENTADPNAARVNKLKNQLDKVWKQIKSPHTEDQKNWEKANTSLQNLEATLSDKNRESEKNLETAQGLLTKMETELEQGELHNALETRTRLQKLGKGHGKDRDWQQIHKRMGGMQARLRELREWHHWSNNKVRKRLIAEMEVLPAADLHPDALLDRIKSLQMEWKALEQSEQIPGDKHFAAAPWMWRKFSAAGHAAFDTVKPYLDKRSEIQSRHAQSLATFCAELEQLAQSDPIDWTALSKGLNRGRKKLHDLNNIPARQRQKFARKLKAALDDANAVMQVHYQEVEVNKMKLIRAASQLIHMPERSEAITQAKSLQSSWKAAGSLWRSKEQALWNEFRSHLDPLFAELKQQQASIRAADDERLAVQKALCKELREILKSNEDLSAQHGRVQGLQDSWKDISHPDRKLLASFQEMVATYERKITRAEQQKVSAERERLWLKSSLLHELLVSGRTAKGAISKKTETRVASTWPEEASDDPLESGMDQLCKDIMKGKTPAHADENHEELREQAHALCIRLEFVAGLPSPEEDRDQRMKYQVDRLAESMSGEVTRQPAVEEAAEAEKMWLGMYALPEPEFKAFGKRIKQALSKIMENS